MGKFGRVMTLDLSRYGPKFDLADLIDSGVTGDDLIAVIEECMRMGPPEISPDHAQELKKKEKARKLNGAGKRAAAGGNVAPMPAPKPKTKPEPVDLPLEYSEDELAEKFTGKYKRTMVYCGDMKRWLSWTGHVWKEDNSGLAVDLARKVCREVANEAANNLTLGSKAKTIAGTISSRRVFNSVAEIAKCDRRHVVKREQFDADPWVLNTPQGILDLRTGDLRPAKRTEWCMKSAVCAPDPEMEKPNFDKYIEAATRGDKTLQGYLQRVAGYCLTGSTLEQKFFFLYGVGGSGKGTYANLLNWMLADYGRQAQMDTFVEQKFTKHASEIAFFQGARIVVASETSTGQRWNESRIKTMTGGDPLTANFMYNDPFTFIPTFKLIFLGNHRPRLVNVDHSIKRRLYMIPFDHKVPEKEIIFDLDIKLQKEAPAIMQWALEGCLEWQQTGLNPPDAVLGATADYFEAEDKIGTFLDECCHEEQSMTVGSTELYSAFTVWADGQGEYVEKRTVFFDMLRARGYAPTKRGGRSIVDGLGLKA